MSANEEMNCQPSHSKTRNYKAPSKSHKCIICRDRMNDWPDRIFHGFPKNPQLSNKWATIIGKPWVFKAPVDARTRRFKVCSSHFIESDYHTPSKLRLRATAIPKLDISSPVVSLTSMKESLHKILNKSLPVEPTDTTEFDITTTPKSVSFTAHPMQLSNENESISDTPTTTRSVSFAAVPMELLYENESISGNITSTSCSYCKKSFHVEKLSSHEKKCRIKCPECSDIILLQNWDEHECQILRVEAAANTTESFAVHHHAKILQDFKEMLLNQENCDVVLIVKGREFQAHKNILAARSSVFASTFRNDMKEKETGIVDISDCSPSTFSEFLCFLYSDDVDSLSEENVFDLFIAADKYDITDLRQKCLEFMKQNLSVETFCETLTLALQHSEAELIH